MLWRYVQYRHPSFASFTINIDRNHWASRLSGLNRREINHARIIVTEVFRLHRIIRLHASGFKPPLLERPFDCESFARFYAERGRIAIVDRVVAPHHQADQPTQAESPKRDLISESPKHRFGTLPHRGSPEGAGTVPANSMLYGLPPYPLTTAPPAVKKSRLIKRQASDQVFAPNGFLKSKL